MKHDILLNERKYNVIYINLRMLLIIDYINLRILYAILFRQKYTDYVISNCIKFLPDRIANKIVEQSAVKSRVLINVTGRWVPNLHAVRSVC